MHIYMLNIIRITQKNILILFVLLIQIMIIILNMTIFMKEVMKIVKHFMIFLRNFWMEIIN